MSKILWFDTETTGLTERSTIVQIAGIIEIDGEVKKKFNLRCRPFPGSEMSDKAFEITGLSKEEVMQYPDPKQVCQELKNIFARYIDKWDRADKFIVAGHNVRFDVDQLTRWFRNCGDKYLGSWINYRKQLDTLGLFMAMQIADVMPELENAKLETIAKFMGIEFDAHDAMADIEATRYIGSVMLGKMKKYIPKNCMVNKIMVNNMRED